LDEQARSQPSDDPEPPAGEIAQRCTSCRTEIASEFYLLRGRRVCRGCGEAIAQHPRGRATLPQGLGFGLVTAALCAFTWSTATVASGRPLLGLALVVGALIGTSVRKGSGGRGGWRSQVAAALLVYGAFVARYVPPVFGGIAEAIRKEHAVSTTTTPTPTATATATATATTTTTDPGEARGGGEKTSALATVKAYFVFAVVAWGLVLASPFLPATSSPWGLLALGAGMALAFHLSRRDRIEGPFANP
jgi:hypothetical protein